MIGASTKPIVAASFSPSGSRRGAGAAVAASGAAGGGGEGGAGAGLGRGGAGRAGGRPPAAAVDEQGEDDDLAAADRDLVAVDEGFAAGDGLANDGPVAAWLRAGVRDAAQVDVPLARLGRRPGLGQRRQRGVAEKPVVALH